MAVALAVLSAAAALLLTGWVRHYALRAGMVDRPGERSSHTAPTPRGGGLAIGACLLAATVVLFLAGIVDGRLAAALVVGGAPVMLVAWREDRAGVPAPLRAVVYVAVAALGLFLQGGVDSLAVGETRIPFGLAGNALLVIGLAWLINLYNFMDGTDGLAATQAVTASVVAGGLFLVGGESGAAWVCLILASACVGFLYWNWPPARIFMGDTGSCLLGFTFGMLALAGENSGAVPLLAWLILLSLFVCDATLTLLKRFMRGQKWYSAHRSHAYQLLVQAGISHRQLAIAVLAVNACLLCPLAILAALRRDYLLPAALAALALGSALWIIVQWRCRPRPEAG
ncbi:MAG: glycosyltransferase family 4 protein [Gammaproteobacteria bacterium]|nr:glycosyltransferase family 4 protein [Gammaproteobacteria bacterium]